MIPEKVIGVLLSWLGLDPAAQDPNIYLSYSVIMDGTEGLRLLPFATAAANRHSGIVDRLLKATLAILLAKDNIDLNVTNRHSDTVFAEAVGEVIKLWQGSLVWHSSSDGAWVAEQLLSHRTVNTSVIADDISGHSQQGGMLLESWNNLS
ncbi:hypothetical protein EMCG_07699 [[Emmonsia] crescens]|uniref:Uncharacterized protein n=1 Tax=[Emmonsia] crescens TaxID=73230 RepID=A0A0G2I8K4_9EURO|nr:hypothetical protein EMCG_07699 [Emmonsia crescens UAMH 3008]